MVRAIREVTVLLIVGWGCADVKADIHELDGFYFQNIFLGSLQPPIYLNPSEPDLTFQTQTLDLPDIVTCHVV